MSGLTEKKTFVAGTMTAASIRYAKTLPLQTGIHFKKVDFLCH